MKSFALWSTIIGLCIVVNIPIGFAQQQLTVGDLLSKGAKKLTKDDMQKLYSGATVSGMQAGHPETTFQNLYLADGSITGRSWRNGLFNGSVSGTWSINDVGQICHNLANGFKSCGYHFRLADKVYAALSETKTELTYERTFTR